MHTYSVHAIQPHARPENAFWIFLLIDLLMGIGGRKVGVAIFVSFIMAVDFAPFRLFPSLYTPIKLSFLFHPFGRSFNTPLFYIRSLYSTAGSVHHHYTLHPIC